MTIYLIIDDNPEDGISIRFAFKKYLTAVKKLKNLKQNQNLQYINQYCKLVSLKVSEK